MNPIVAGSRFERFSRATGLVFVNVLHPPLIPITSSMANLLFLFFLVRITGWLLFLFLLLFYFLWLFIIAIPTDWT